jgi:hypothetical protein
MKVPDNVNEVEPALGLVALLLLAKVSPDPVRPLILPPTV